MIQDREFRQLCKSVADEFDGITTEDVMEMVKDSFEFAQKHISEGSLTPIYFQYLGRFSASPGRRKWLKERDNVRKQRELSAQEGREDAPQIDGVRNLLEGSEEEDN